MNKSLKIIPEEIIERRICVINGHNVMFDFDLADLYGVPTKVLNQAVTRNKDRFPADFMFRLSAADFENLKSQTVTSSWGGRRHPPRAFTEHGILMLSSVLRSKRAVQVNITIMRTFVHMRETMASHKELARKIMQMEQKYDSQFKAIFDAIRRLMEPLPEPPKRPIGYIYNKE